MSKISSAAIKLENRTRGLMRKLPEIISRVENAGIDIVKRDVEKVLEPQEWGWRIASFDLRMPNGQLVEYYLPVRELEEAKDEGHVIFEKWRNRPETFANEGEKRERAADVARSQALYQRGWDAFLARSGISESEIRAALASAAASPSGSGLKSSLRLPHVWHEGVVQTPPTLMAEKPTPQTTTMEGSSRSTYARNADIDASTQNIGNSGTSDKGQADFSVPQRAHSRSASLTGTEIDVPQPLLRALRLPSGRFWANYAALARKHVQYFPDAAAAKAHVEQVLSEPSVAIPQRSGNIDLVARSGNGDRLIGFRAALRNGRYDVRTAYVLDPGQLERMKEGAAHAGATVLELDSRGHESGQGRNNKDNPGSGFAEGTPAFYPAVARTIESTKQEKAAESTKQEKAAPNQWLGMLKNAPAGKVVGVVTLVSASRLSVFVLRNTQIREVERRFGDVVRNEFGVQPSALTGDEARHLLDFRDADALRTRRVAALRQRGERLHAKGIGPERLGRADGEEGGASGGAASDSGEGSAARIRSALKLHELDVHETAKRTLAA